MTRYLSKLWLSPFSTLAGLMLGASAVAFFPNWFGPVLAAKDEAFPVITPVTSTLVYRTGDEAHIAVVARKNLGDECRLVRLYGYGIDPNGVYSLAHVRRPDGSLNLGIVHEEGVFDLGVWKVFPTATAVRVQILTEHNCLGRLIKSKLSETYIGVNNGREAPKP